MDCVTNLGCSRLEGVYIVLRFFLGLSKGGKGGTKGGYKREILSDLILSDLTNFRSISILTSDFTRPKFILGVVVWKMVWKSSSFSQETHKLLAETFLTPMMMVCNP